MKKKAVVALLTMTMMLSGTTVWAADYSADIGGEKTFSFDKYLVMDQQANVPNASFTYTVTAGAAKAYDVANRKFQIFAGINPETVTMEGVGSQTANTITYAPGDETAQDDNALVKDYDKSTEKYAKKTATLDFSACNFTEPGIYRYIVTESGTNQAITNDTDTTRVVDVYVADVSDDTGNKLTIQGYVLHSNADDAPEIPMNDEAGSGGGYADTKSQGFTNAYDTSDLTFRKEVEGNQASHNKYFEFTVTIADAVPGTEYNVDITKADATSGQNAATISENAGKTNVTKLTVGQDGSVSQKFYLQHGQEITIQGIAKDSTYAVTENEEDYKQAVAEVTDYTAPARGTIESTDLKTSYLNKRNGVIPTGVVMTVAPFAAVTLLGAAGMVKLKMGKKKDDEEE